jgi:hypothetical protein
MTNLFLKLKPFLLNGLNNIFSMFYLFINCLRQLTDLIHRLPQRRSINGTALMSPSA